MTSAFFTGNQTAFGQEYALVTFQLTPDYACEVFQSCEQEPFIAEAGLTSSLAFMDFLGVNGMNQSL